MRFVETESLCVIAEIKTNEGAVHLSEQGAGAHLFSQVFKHHLASLFQKAGASAERCVISGMATSSIGWMELPYAKAPLIAGVKDLRYHTLKEELDGEEIEVTLVSGVRAEADVMRGEECEVMGLMEMCPFLKDADQLVILPGTHSKHVRLRDGVLEGLSTYMTGELFNHLMELPTLRACFDRDKEFSDQDFLAGVREGASAGVSSALFRIRAQVALGERTLQARAYLSGVLIGAEVIGLSDEASVTLACSDVLHPIYASALSELCVAFQSIPPEKLQRALLYAHRLFAFS